MVATFRSQGAAVAGSTSITTAAYGTGWADGDLAICAVASNHATTETNKPTVAGFTEFATLNGGGGTQGAGTGNRRITLFYRVVATGDDTTPAIDLTGGDVMIAAITIYQKETGDTWNTPVGATGAETTAGTGWDQAMTSNPGFRIHDQVALFCAVRDDTATTTAEGITATAATFGTVTERIDANSGTGNDIALHVSTCTVTGGIATAAPNRTATHATSETGVMAVARIGVTPALTVPYAHVTFNASATATSHVTDSFTPRADSRIFAFLWTNFANQTSSIADSGSRSWTQEAQATSANNANRIYVWSALAGASPSSMTITFTHTGAHWAGYCVMDVDADLAVSQAAADAIASGATTSSGTLGTAATSGNTVLTFFGNNDDNGSGVPENGAGWTTVMVAPANINVFEPTRVSYSTTFTGTNVSIAHDETGNASGGAILELAASAAVTGVAAASLGGTFTTAGVPTTHGTAAASLGGSFTAAGVDTALGTAAASLGGTFTASGTAAPPPVTGQAVATFGGAFDAAGIDRAVGQAAASLGGSATAAGIDRALGQAAATFGGQATALGVDRAIGQAAASLGGTATTAGVVRHMGLAEAALGGTFTATGFAGTPPVQGQAAATLGGTFTGAGVRRTPGSGAASFGGSFTAAGIPTTSGAAAATFGFTATAAGVDRAVGQAQAALGGSFTTTGTRRPIGTAAASLGGTFTANGVAGTPPVTGQAAASLGGTFTASGIDTALGQATASLGGSGTAVGRPRHVGQAVASLGGSAVAQSVRRVFGAAAAALGFTAHVDGLAVPPFTGETPPERVLVVEAEDRFVTVAAENRVMTVEAENRHQEA